MELAESVHLRYFIRYVQRLIAIERCMIDKSSGPTGPELLLFLYYILYSLTNQ